MKNEFDEIMHEIAEGPFSILSDRAVSRLKILIMKANSIGYAVEYEQGYDEARKYAEKLPKEKKHPCI